jgi:hypothetical protein
MTTWRYPTIASQTWRRSNSALHARMIVEEREHQLMAMFRWATSKEAERYTKTAERKRWPAKR